MLVSFLVLFALVSCASKSDTTEEKPQATKDSKELDKMLEGIPGFYLNPPISNTIVYGVGSAKMQKLDASRKMAIARARDDIAFQIRVQVQSSIVDYYQEAGEGDGTQALSFSENISRQIADTTLSGAKPEEVAAGPDGTIYALVSFPKDGVLKAAEDAFTRNEDAAFAEFKANEALARLDATLTDSPTTAGTNSAVSGGATQ